MPRRKFQLGSTINNSEGRTVVSLSFCDGTCSIESLLTQVPQAVKAVREHVANNSVFNDGYIFIGHSQGGPISHFGRYSEVDTIDEIETQYMNLTIVNMPDTLEYTSDTFGLFMQTVEDVSHSCWCGDEGDCKFWPIYDKYLYPVLV
ncbi:hypothetical protein V7S43_014944 [Phytophthora oleae]|uniref:Uncharacterized protein n=1 Tax=Phytophthora oleae TaxID=2107226 RepID=A0ABD3F4K0_9STRA